MRMSVAQAAAVAAHAAAVVRRYSVLPDEAPVGGVLPVPDTKDKSSTVGLGRKMSGENMTWLVALGFPQQAAEKALQEKNGLFTSALHSLLQASEVNSVQGSATADQPLGATPLRLVTLDGRDQTETMQQQLKAELVFVDESQPANCPIQAMRPATQPRPPLMGAVKAGTPCALFAWLISDFNTDPDMLEVFVTARPFFCKPVCERIFFSKSGISLTSLFLFTMAGRVLLPCLDTTRVQYDIVACQCFPLGPG
jgi:hypothetical protein